MSSLELGTVVEYALQNKELLMLFGTLLIGALTARQVKAIRERDGNRCMGREVGINTPHRGRLEVNHVPPQAWSIEHGLDPDEYPIIALLTLCEACHDEYHRREISNAKNEYHKGNKEAFKDMGHRHHVMARNNEIFWNSEYDVAIQTVSRQNDKKARIRGWRWPEKRKN